MSKNISLSTLAFATAILVGVPLTACSAEKKLSEKAACNMAIDQFKKNPRGIMCGATRMPDNKIMGSCKNFLSNSEQGWANIDVPYEWVGCYASEQHLRSERTYKFQRFDQGWKIVN